MALTVTFFVASTFLVFIHGVAPFGFRALWVDEGAGHRMVLSAPLKQPVLPGVHVAFWSNGTQGAVQLATIEEMARVDGMAFYRPAGGEWQLKYAASRTQGEVVMTVPLLGYIVRALLHPLGLMALVGAPFVMFVVDLLQTMYIRLQTRNMVREYATMTEDEGKEGAQKSSHNKTSSKSDNRNGTYTSFFHSHSI
jgi:hypothetical protein